MGAAGVRVTVQCAAFVRLAFPPFAPLSASQTLGPSSTFSLGLDGNIRAPKKKRKGDEEEVELVLLLLLLLHHHRQ